MDNKRSETNKLLRERYGRMRDILLEFKIGMSAEGSLSLNIPKCPTCTEPKSLEHCKTSCYWADVFGVCKKMSGRIFPEYEQIVYGLNQAISGYDYILSKLENLGEELNR